MFNIKPRLQRWVEWDAPILNKQVKMLYDAFPSSLLANLATAGLMSLVQWSAINHRHLMAWWVSLVVVLLMRIGLYAEYKHSYFNLKKIVLLHAFRLSVLVTGAVWGGVGIYFFAPDDIPHQFVLAFLLAGLTSAAITTLAVDKWSAMLFVAPCLLPITINLTFENARLGYAMAGMVIFFIVYVYVSAVRLEREIHEAIRIQSILESQKQELSNQKTLDEIIAKVQGDFIDKVEPSIFLQHMLSNLLPLINSANGFIVYKKNSAAALGDRIVVGDNAADLSHDKLNDGFDSICPEGTLAKTGDAYRMRLPVYLSTDLVAVIGFNRKSFAYTMDDVNFITPLLLMLRQILDAMFLQQTHREVMQDYIRLSHVASQITNGVVLTDIEGKIIWVNDGFARLTEYDNKEVIGKKPGDFLQGAQTENAVVLTMRQALAARENFNVNIINYSKGGKPYWVNIICNPLLNEDGELAGFMAIETNIDEQKKAEQELQYTNRLMEQSNAVALTGTWRVNLEPLMVEWSAVTKAIHEVPEVYSPSVEDALSFYKVGAHRVRISYVFNLAVAEGVSFDEELIIVSARGHEKWVRAIGIPEFHNGKCHAIFGTFQDISEGKRIERVKNEFISMVSHELRTPLTSISGALGLMRSGALGHFGEKAEQLIDIAHKNSLRLSHMINDLLDVEKLAAGKMDFDMKLVDVNKAVIHALAAIKSYADEYGVLLASQIHPVNALIFVDENRFQQILANFISNAIKFSPSAGEVVVAVSVTDAHIRVSVTDKGIGISDEFKERIFSKFSQEDSSDTRKKGGTGLGLAISRQLAEQMKGRVDFYSELGRGSTFFCEFPVVKS